MLQVGSVEAPIQPYEYRFSSAELGESEVGRERAPALKHNKRKLLRCMIYSIELEDDG